MNWDWFLGTIKENGNMWGENKRQNPFVYFFVDIGEM